MEYTKGKHGKQSVMVWNTEDTIAASAAAAGTSERGIVRISGPSTVEAVAAVFIEHGGGATWQTTRVPRRFIGHVRGAGINALIPAALCFWPTRRSFTGEVLAELHLPGSEPVLEAVLEELFRHGVRMARRGEFTLRAFLHGRIDLLQAEAVLGVIEAADHEELQLALGQLGGRITGRLQQLREDLIALVGDIEAGLDFVEEDIEFVSQTELQQRIERAQQLIAGLLEDSAGRVLSGYYRRIVLAGLPNAGKSTLFNALAGRDQAIVSPIPGTTRDYLSARILLDNVPVELIDTAGWEQAGEIIGAQAQRFREEQMRAADLVLWCSAADLTPEQSDMDASLRRKLLPHGTRCLVVHTRIDLATNAADVHSTDAAAVAVSVLADTGLDRLRAAAHSALTAGSQARSELLSASSVRCRNSLQRALDCLDRAQQASHDELGDELLSLELRGTLRELQEVSGEVCTDDLLDHIFSRFCIGK
ncbi:MAG: tRNA modification GTPase MnmE [Planctomycetota bacterium]|jgi:tRNA modification GTPase